MVVAPFGNAQESRIRLCEKLPVSFQGRLGALTQIGLTASGQSSLHRQDDIGIASGAADGVHLRHLLENFLLIPFHQTAGGDESFQLPFFFQPSLFQNGVDGLLFGFVDKSTGVDNGHIGLAEILHDLHSLPAQQRQHLLGIDQILGTAQGIHMNLYGQKSIPPYLRQFPALPALPSAGDRSTHRWRC